SDRTRSHRRWPNLPTLSLDDPQGDPVGAAAVEGLRRPIEPLGPGRYHVDEIAAVPLASGHTSRRWGSAIGVFCISPRKGIFRTLLGHGRRCGGCPAEAPGLLGRLALQAWPR